MEPARVLVTGGLGFIGSNVAAYLTRQGCLVSVLDAHPADHLPSHIRDVGTSIHWSVGDVTDWETVSSAVRGQDFVIHLADPPSFMMYEESPITSTVDTTKAFLNVLEAARRHRVNRVVYASTSTVYKGNERPFREDMTVRPTELKSLSKKWKEDVALLYAARYSPLVTVGFRPFTLYGPGEEGKGGFASVVSLFCWAMMNGNRPVVWGDGTQTRDYVYIDDAVRVIGRALEHDVPTGVFNLGSGSAHSFNDVVAAVNHALGSGLEPEYVPAASSTYASDMVADVELMRTTLRYVPDTALAEGVRKTVEYLRTGSTPESNLAEAQLLFRSILGHQS